MSEIVINIILWSLPVVFTFTIVEIAKGWMAYQLGDRTAKNNGALGLNPVSHIDLVGTIIIPITLIVLKVPLIIGWAKSIPVYAQNLRNPRLDLVLIALAAPGANLIMACFWTLLIKFSTIIDIQNSSYDFLRGMSERGLFLNVVFMVFSMLPILPLAGGKVVQVLLPQELSDIYGKTEPYGMFILLGLVFMGILTPIIIPIINYFTLFFLLMV